MTLNELKNDVACLGFESYVEDEECFLASANRALSLIYTDRPMSKTAIIPLRGPKANLTREFIEHASGEEIVIPFSGKSISFRTSGKGMCKITDESGANIVPLSMDNQLTKRFLKGSGNIVFYGDYYYTVSNLAIFDDSVSAESADIPEYTPFKEVSISEYCNDFRAFIGQPRGKDGNPVSGVSLIDGRIRVPYNLRGEIYLTYYRSPKAIDAENGNARIDISEECAPLLPLLTASFTWLDEDAAKAQYYMSLYRDLAAGIKRYSTSKIDTVYSVNGWA